MSEPIRELIPEETVEKVQEQSMHWHGFLTKFMLYLAAAYHVFQAVWILLGKIYYETAARDVIYADMPALRIADYGFAALLVCAAVLQVCAAVQLLRRKRKGIGCIKAAYIMLAAAVPAHVLARFLISGLPPLNLPAFAQTAAYLALLGVNALYYRRRSELFD